MTDREQYTPGPASGAQVRKDGEKWTLILVCELDVRVGGSWRMVFDAGDYILREGLRDR